MATKFDKEMNDDILNFCDSGISWDENDKSEVTTNNDIDVQKKSKRRTTERLELSQKYEYKRAFSEVKLLESMKYCTLKENHTYNFITGGDVDALSYLKIILNEQKLHHLLFSTWSLS